MAAGPSEADAAQDLLGAPLPPILQEGPKPAPPATGSLGIADRTASVVNAAPRSLQRNEAGFEPPAAAVAGSIVAERQQRLDALETELGQLIDRSATWPHPLDARRPVSLAHQPAPTLEPDTAVELDVDEAEVTIVRLAEPEATIREYPIRPPPRVKPPKPEPEPDERPNGEDYAGYRLELEEASVEIIVPDAAGGGEGAPPGKNRAE